MAKTDLFSLSFRRFFSMGLIWLSLLTTYVSATPSPSSVTWRPLVQDLEGGTLSYSTGTFRSGQFTAFRSALKKHQVQILQASDYGKTRLDVKSLCNQAHALLCINANFFDPSGQALGRVVSRGRVIHPMHQGGNTLTGIFFAGRNRFGISSRADFSLQGVVEASQAGPRLISGGRPVPGLRETSTSRRSGVCIDKENRLVVFAIADIWGQTSNEDVAQILTDPSVGCVEALNLDGGGSSQFYVDSSALGAGEQELWLSGRDDVPIAISISARDPG